jgi:hypothetical protein
VPVTGSDDVDVVDKPAATPPWHNSTPAVAGASVAALAMIGLVVAAAVYLTGQFGEPDRTPAEFVDSTSATTPTAPGAPATPSTTETITSTSPIVTTDINLPTDTPTSTPETPSSGAATSSRRPDDGSAPSTTHRRPRYNETRTLYPVPVN